MAAGGIGGKKKMGEKIENGRFFFVGEEGRKEREMILPTATDVQQPVAIARWREVRSVPISSLFLHPSRKMWTSFEIGGTKVTFFPCSARYMQDRRR